ncbi:MAG: hypothetical protein HYU76_06785, partial [Betaproteobacteria bacterium]|nr:hypothetical protein [Betaproteobacteria bacterium]
MKFFRVFLAVVAGISLGLMLTSTPGGSAHAKKDKGKKDDFFLAQAYIHGPPAAQATVSRMLVNPFGEVDGVLLDTGALVTFPPHMSEQLAAAVKSGDAVEVKGYPEMPGQIKGYVITNSRTGQAVMVHPKPPAGMKPPPHLRGIGLKEMSAQGEIRHVRHGGKGEINGAILADGTIVRFPREVSYRFGHLFRVGQGIAASGYGTQNQHGRAF